MWWNNDPGWGGWLMMAIGVGSFWILGAVLAVEGYQARLVTLTRASR